MWPSLIVERLLRKAKPPGLLMSVGLCGLQSVQKQGVQRFLQLLRLRSLALVIRLMRQIFAGLMKGRIAGFSLYPPVLSLRAHQPLLPAGVWPPLIYLGQAH